VVATWRLSRRRADVEAALRRLCERGEVVPCALRLDDGRTSRGWVRPRDLELAERLAATRPRDDRGVLLSPFDPLLWDRGRVAALFGFRQVLEIFKPARQRLYGYYCLPVLAGDRLVARVDLKADRRRRRLGAAACHLEEGATPRHREALRGAVARHAAVLGLRPPDSLAPRRPT
jgi:uncharacterized protein YcaQ